MEPASSAAAVAPSCHNLYNWPRTGQEQSCLELINTFCICLYILDPNSPALSCLLFQLRRLAVDFLSCIWTSFSIMPATWILPIIPSEFLKFSGRTHPTHPMFWMETLKTIYSIACFKGKLSVWKNRPLFIPEHKLLNSGWMYLREDFFKALHAKAGVDVSFVLWY